MQDPIPGICPAPGTCLCMWEETLEKSEGKVPPVFAAGPGSPARLCQRAGTLFPRYLTLPDVAARITPSPGPSVWKRSGVPVQEWHVRRSAPFWNTAHFRVPEK